MAKLNLLDLYGRASEWTLSKADGAAQKLDAATPCEDWEVRALMNHMLDPQNYFVGTAPGEDVSPPSPQPPELLGDDPEVDFEQARATAVNGSETTDESGRRERSEVQQAASSPSWS